MLKNKVRKYIEQHHMIQKGSRLVVGISGGADSVCLLHILADLRQEYGMTLTAVHIHHGIRGPEAEEDARYVQEICASLKVPCRQYDYDVPKLAAERRMTVEEAGRMVRYEAFYQVLKEEKADKIAVAHHMGDNSETILFHMCRGTGLQGMCGILPVRGSIIRPLLHTAREEIEAYLMENRIQYRVDSTNLQNDYIRNSIRNVVLPYLTEHVNRQTIRHIAAVGENLLQVYAYVAEQGETAWERYAVLQESAYEVGVEGIKSVLYEEKLLEEHPVIQHYVIRRGIEELAGSLKDITAVHIEDIRTLFAGQVSKSIDLPYQLQAVKTYEGVKLHRAKEQGIEHTCIEVGETTSYTCQGSRLSFQKLEKNEKISEIPEKMYTKWFDCDKIKNTLQIRNRLPGDYLTIDEKGHRQKLNDYFVNEKIPKEQRDSILLLADGAHILWVVGHRISTYYKITDSTSCILQVSMESSDSEQ